MDKKAKFENFLDSFENPQTSAIVEAIKQGYTAIFETYEEELIEKIKKALFIFEGYDSWEEYVNNQEIGDCQFIVSFITKDFPIAKKVFGEIKVDEPYIDEDGEEQNLMTHHWVKIGNKEYDFSKGTLKNYIDFQNVYDPEIEDETIYHGF